jgi:2-keto-3-deoxy-L-rhamnonate aldolase RhmA
MIGDEVNKVKRAKETGRPLLGMSMYSFSPTVTEALGFSGVEFLFIDNEHTPASWETLENVIRACETSGIAPMVRVDKQYPGYPSNIRRAYEIGASMVLVPHINTKEEALSVVRAAKFGSGWESGPSYDQVRGSGLLSRAGRYGNISLADWQEMENENRLVALMMEEPRAVDNAEEILSVEGLDMINVGTSDLTTNLGIPGETSDKRVRDRIKKVRSIEKKYPGKFIKQTNIDFLEALTDPEKAKEKIKEQLREGACIFNLTHELSILRIIIRKCKGLLDEAYSEFEEE